MFQNKNRLEYKADLSRHPHDTSAGYTSSLAPGLLVPQYFDILGPGDSVYYRTHLFARLQDMVTAFLGEIDMHVDYFFVPLQMIYTPFGQIFAQTDDYLTSLYANTISSKDTFPLLGIDHSFQVNQSYNLGGIPELECRGKNVMRFLDAIDMNPYEVLHSDFYPTGYNPPSGVVSDVYCHNLPVAPWIPCAYQAIYQKYYRNDEFEHLMVDQYNVDSYYNTISVNLNQKWFGCNYVQRPSDYFTSTRVSPIASAVNKLGSTVQFPSDGGNLGSLINKVDSFLGFERSSGPLFGFVNSPNSGISGTTTPFEAVSNYNQYDKPSGFSLSAISASNIRALFAVDKFTRIYGRADKTYDDQILAYFGIEIPHDVKHDLTHLKHYHMVIQTDPIFGTANTVDSQDSKFLGTIGQVGGQGQAVLDTDQEKFTAPVHGVFMAVAYVVTKPRYVNTFSKLHLCTNRLAFPIPEFDKLGAQPVYAWEFSRYFLKPDVTTPSPLSWRAVRRGWQNRYAQFKKKYNRASMVFEKPNGTFVPVGYSENIYSSWVVNRAPFYQDEDASAVSTFIDALKFYENPHNLDNVMVRPYVSSWSNDWFVSPWLAFQTDPVISEFMCYCKKVSWMSETGEPDL